MRISTAAVTLGRAAAARSHRLLLVMVLLCQALVLAGPARAAESYQLGPGDQIVMQMVAWDAITQEFQEFDALKGTYAIEQDGQVSLPLLGRVRAADTDVASLGEMLSEQYRSRLGVVEPPSVTVSVAKYRPVYIMGEVAGPGRYEFQPGITAIQALAMAGGIRRIDEIDANTATPIRTRGALAEIATDLAREYMREARLQAEMDGAARFEQPDLPDHPDGAAAQQSLYDHEQSLFESRSEGLQRALTSLEGSKLLLEAEIEALEVKQTGMLRQVDMVREAVGNMETLRASGLARSPTVIALQRTLIDLEARELDADTSMFRARQELSELDRDRNDLVSGRQVSVLRELQDTRTNIERLKIRQNTNRQLLANAQVLLTDTDDGMVQQYEFTILRNRDGVQVRIPGVADTALKPLDVLEVRVITLVD